MSYCDKLRAIKLLRAINCWSRLKKNILEKKSNDSRFYLFRKTKKLFFTACLKVFLKLDCMEVEEHFNDNSPKLFEVASFPPWDFFFRSK